MSSNAAAYFSNGLKGRAEEDKFDDDHVLAGNMYVLDMMDDSGRIIREEVPMRNALNEVLRDWYVGDCQAGVDRWNKRVLEAHGMSERIVLPSRRFNRKVGVYAGKHFDPFGNQLTPEEWERQKYEWLPSPADKALPAQHPGDAGLQAGAVRQLHRAAAARHQPPADRLRIRAHRSVKRHGHGATRRHARPVALRRLRQHRRHGVLILLAGPDAVDLLDRQDHDLAVTNVAGPCRRDDGVDCRLHEVARHADLDPHLLRERHLHGRAAVVLDVLCLAAMALHAADRQPTDLG